MIAQVFCAKSVSEQIEVTPYLVNGQTIWIEQFSCGGPWLRSPEYHVATAPPLRPPTIIVSPIAGDRSVTVDAIPGSWVEVFSRKSDGRQQRIGSGFVDPIDSRVPLSEPLQEDSVYAQQWFCGDQSRPGESHPVAPGEITFKLKQPKKHPVVSKDVVWNSGTLILRRDGAWRFTVSAENKDTEGDVDIDFNVSFASGIVPGFGANISLILGSPGDGVGAMRGRVNIGWPPANTVSKSGFFAELLNASYWLEVLKTSVQFMWSPAVTSYVLPGPEDPE
jgi:hypothetical protein